MKIGRALYALVVLSFIAHAAMLWVIPIDSHRVEQIYAGLVYPLLAPVVAFLPSLLPFSVALAAAMLLVLWALWYAFRHLRNALRGRGNLPGALVTVLAVWTAAGILLFHAFYLFWGYNYLRPPLEARLGLVPVDGSQAALAATSRVLVQRTVDAIVPLDSWDRQELDRLLDQALGRVVQELENRPLAVTSPLKSDLGTGLLALTGQGGFISPVTLEAHVNLNQPALSLAFVAAHEKAHLAGFARERDANFVAWYALTTADDPRLQFAGHFGVARFFMNESTADIAGPLLPYFVMMREYQESSVSPAARDMSRGVYGVYMRANRMQAGLADYSAVAQLIHHWLGQPG